MRVVLVAVMMVLLAIPAEARGKRNSAAQPQAGDQQKKSLAEEKAYKAALDKIPNQKPADPWGKMR
jgi:hypothetical protein